MSDPLDLPLLDCPLSGRHLVEASAGTGKTWNLCALFLRLLIEQARPVEQILVLTFTHAATAELRERIRSRLLECRAALSLPAGSTVNDLLIRGLIDRFVGLGIDQPTQRDRLEHSIPHFDQAPNLPIPTIYHHYQVPGVLLGGEVGVFLTPQLGCK